MARNPRPKRNRPSFFKILVGDLFFTSLRVPPAFLNKYLKRIKFPTESTIALKSDPEVSWKVMMEIKNEGEVYFTEGWKKIYKDMKLATEDFLVFYLVGDAAFEIRAYDRTCCERISRWCPSSRSETESGDDDDDDDDGDDDEEEEDEDDDSGYVDEEEEEDGDQDEEEEEDGEVEEIDSVVIEPGKPTWNKNQSDGELDRSELIRAPQPAGLEFASKYPFFQVNITKDCLSHGRLHVPWKFAKANMNNTGCRHQIVTLGTGGGRSWLVKNIIDSYPRHHAKFYGGLKAFLKENYVKEGDLCTFELINRKNLVFRVSISRG